MDKPTLYPDLEPIAKNASYKQIFDLLYTLSLVRYATFKQLHSVNHRVCTKKNLVKMAEFGYLSQTKNNVFFTTQKTWELLQGEGYNTKIIQKNLTGETLEHELKITDVLLKLQPWRIFYPTFIDLVPDACVIYLREDGFYKIEFLEVEEPKPNWDEYLKRKQDAYFVLSKDFNLWDKWWRRWHRLLDLPFCLVEDFKFTYRVVRNG